MILCTGEDLYERAKDLNGASWDELDDEGKAIWRDAEQLISDRLAGDPDHVAVKFSRRLVEAMGDWGPPVQCKFQRLADGRDELCFRQPGGEEIPDKVAGAVRERVYGVFDEGVETFLNDARDIVQTALHAWRT